MNHFQTKTTWPYFLASSSILLAFLYSGFFAVPSADDYFYANFARDHGFFNSQIRYYTGWSGRYTATFLITLFSLTNYEHYWLTPWGSIISLSLSFFVFLNTVLADIRKNLNIALLTLSFMALYLSVKTAGYDHGITVINEGFFWFTGSVTYVGSLVIYLILVSSLIWLVRGYHTLLNYCTCLLLSVLVIGMHETAMFMVCITILPWLFLKHRQIGRARSILWAILIILCSLVVYLAPGNDVRMATSDGGNIFSALGVCVEKVVQIFFYYLTNPFIWLFTLFFKSSIDTIVETLSENMQKNYLYSLGALLIYLLYFPVAYSLNAGAPDRLIAFIGFFALILSVFYTSSIYDWLLTKTIPRKAILITLVGLAISGSYFFIEPLRIAATTTLYGPQFHQAHMDRAKSVQENKKAGNYKVVVDVIPQNKLLIFEDLRPNNQNLEYARFHGVKAVHLSPLQ